MKCLSSYAFPTTVHAEDAREVDVTIVEDVQCKLVELMVVFDLEQGGAVPETKGKADEMLRQLEASKSTAIKQDLADELLSEFGFK